MALWLWPWSHPLSVKYKGTGKTEEGTWHKTPLPILPHVRPTRRKTTDQQFSASSYRMLGGSAQAEGWGPPFLCLLLRLGAHRLAGPTHTGEAICFTQFTNSNVSLFWKHPHRHTQKCSTSYLGILQLSRLAFTCPGFLPGWLDNLRMPCVIPPFPKLTIKVRICSSLLNTSKYFQSGCSYVHSYQPCLWVLVIPHAHQHFLFSVLFVLMSRWG